MSKWAEKSWVKGRWLVRSRQLEQHREADCWKAPSVWKAQCSGHFKQTSPVTSINHPVLRKRQSQNLWDSDRRNDEQQLQLFSAVGGGSNVGVVTVVPLGIGKIGSDPLPFFLFFFPLLYIRDSEEGGCSPLPELVSDSCFSSRPSGRLGSRFNVWGWSTGTCKARELLAGMLLLVHLGCAAGAPWGLEQSACNLRNLPAVLSWEAFKQGSFNFLII